MNSPSSDTIQITVNGLSRAIQPGLNIPHFLEILGVDPSRVAVERNRAIVRKTDWESTTLEPGDELEVVWFVGGGSN